MSHNRLVTLNMYVTRFHILFSLCLTCESLHLYQQRASKFKQKPAVCQWWWSTSALGMAIRYSISHLNFLTSHLVLQGESLRLYQQGTSEARQRAAVCQWWRTTGHAEAASSLFVCIEECSSFVSLFFYILGLPFNVTCCKNNTWYSGAKKLIQFLAIFEKNSIAIFFFFLWVYGLLVELLTGILMSLYIKLQLF